MERVLKIVAVVLITALVGYLLVVNSAEVRRSVAERDSIAYWTAGWLLLHHQNPYDAQVVLTTERQRGYAADKPLVLRTPPWSLLVTVPLGFLDPFGAWILWTTISFGSLLVAMRLCWKMYGERATPRYLFSVVGYTFAPIPACLIAGQMGLLLLLGLCLFVWWERDRPLLAGLVLLLPFIKPYLLSLFWAVLVLWVITRKKRDIAIGFAIAGGAGITVALLFDPHIFQHYRDMLHRASIQYEFIPALSGVLRMLFFRRVFLVQFVPLMLGLVWCIWFWNRNQQEWNWRQHGPALLIVSVLTTPYAWLTDEVVVLPAILQAAAFVYQSCAEMRLGSRLVLFTFAFLDGLLLLTLRFKIPFATGIYFWSSLIWFSWYVYGWRRNAFHEREEKVS